LAEPTTALTDFALAVLAVVLAFRLRRSAHPLPAARRLWVAAFLLSGVGALAGGIRHALAEETASVARRDLWSLTYLLLGLANLAFLSGLVRSYVPRAFRLPALVLLALRCAFVAVVLLRVPDLRLVVADFALSLVLILAFSLHSLVVTRDGAGPWLLSGVVVSAAGALVQALGVPFVPGLTHSDLFHVVQMGGLWLFYRGGLPLRDRDAVLG
jgi:Family of unknown function (DUF6962)